MCDDLALQRREHIQLTDFYMLMPTLFGLIVDDISISLLPVFIFVFLLLMTAMHEIMAKKAACTFQFTEKEG